MIDGDEGILLVGDDGSGSDPSLGAGACIARTGRFRTALRRGGFRVEVCSPRDSLDSIAGVRERLRGGSWSCVVALSPYPAELVVMAGTDLPLWIDMNGMHPAEVHLTEGAAGEPRLEMLRMLSLENTLLSRGDHFSAPSSRQASALLGELYLLGRLASGDGTAVPVSPVQHCALEAPPSRGPRDPDGPFPVISTGSYNSWFDGETLFRGLEYAMERNGRITFVSTGGSVPFARERYERFEGMVAGSRFGNRFVIRGWVEREELEAVQSEAGAAVYTDIPCPESLLGARTRVLDWISRGIPVVCTEGAEISVTVRTAGMGLTVPQGDHRALGEAFVRLATEPDTVSSVKEHQERWREGEGSMDSVFRPLLDWCRNPTRLPAGQLCPPTVGVLSGTRYRKAVLREVSRRGGPGSASGFLLGRIFRRLRRRRG